MDTIQKQFKWFNYYFSMTIEWDRTFNLKRMGKQRRTQIIVQLAQQNLIYHYWWKLIWCIQVLFIVKSLLIHLMVKVDLTSRIMPTCYWITFMISTAIIFSSLSLTSIHYNMTRRTMAVGTGELLSPWWFLDMCLIGYNGNGKYWLFYFWQIFIYTHQLMNSIH